MLNLIPPKTYKKLKIVDLNNSINVKDNFFGAILCVGTFTYGHVKSNALDEFVRITKKFGYICFTVNEGIYKKNKFDKKILELENKNFLKIISNKKSSYIINKNVKSWLCLVQVIKN